MPAAVFGNQYIVQIQIDLGLVKVVNTGIADGCQNASQIWVTGKKSCFNQR